MSYYTIVAGDCLYAIGVRVGIPWEKIWNDGNNAELRQKRPDPNIIYPGDVLYIPDMQPRTEQGDTNKRHIFVMKGVVARLRLRLVKPDLSRINKDGRVYTFGHDKDVVTEDPPIDESVPTIPRANCAWTLVVDGNETDGTTGDDGKLEVSIRPDANSGTLTLGPGTLEQTILTVNLGHLDPVETFSGAQQRLANLGFPSPDATSEDDDEFVSAVTLFQTNYGLRITGYADSDTRNKLRDAHGS